MKKIEVKEKNGKIKRSWYIQGMELEVIKLLEIPIPKTIKTKINMESIEDIEKFYRFSDDEVFEFIKNQYWMIDEREVANLNLYEIEMLLDYLINERMKIIERISKAKTKNDLGEEKVDLILNYYRQQSFTYLKKERETTKKRK